MRAADGRPLPLAVLRSCFALCLRQPRTSGQMEKEMTEENSAPRFVIARSLAALCATSITEIDLDALLDIVATPGRRIYVQSRRVSGAAQDRPSGEGPSYTTTAVDADTKEAWRAVAHGRARQWVRDAIERNPSAVLIGMRDMLALDEVGALHHLRGGGAAPGRPGVMGEHWGLRTSLHDLNAVLGMQGKKQASCAYQK